MRANRAQGIGADSASEQRPMKRFLIARHDGQNALGWRGERIVVDIFRGVGLARRLQGRYHALIGPIGESLRLNERASYSCTRMLGMKFRWPMSCAR